MAQGLTLDEARAGLIQGILLASEQLYASSASNVSFQYAYDQQRADLAYEAASWLTHIGAGADSQYLQGIVQSGLLHSGITKELRDFEFTPGPQGLRPSVDLAGKSLDLGSGLSVSFTRQSQLGAAAYNEQLPMHLLPSGRLSIPAWPGEPIGVSVSSEQIPWGLQIFFNDINAFSGDRGGASEPLRPSRIPDHAVVRPGTRSHSLGWRDRKAAADRDHPGQYAANRFVPTPLQDGLSAVFRLRLFGLSPEHRVRASEGTIADLIGRLAGNHDSSDKIRRTHRSDSSLESLMILLDRLQVSKDQQTIETELSKILRSDQSLVEMIRKNDPREIPTLQGAGRVWQDEPGQDPYFDMGWTAAFGMSVFVVHPRTFYEWTGIRHEPQRLWPRTPQAVWRDDLNPLINLYLEILGLGLGEGLVSSPSPVLTGKEQYFGHPMGRVLGGQFIVYEAAMRQTMPRLKSASRLLSTKPALARVIGGSFPSGRDGQGSNHQNNHALFSYLFDDDPDEK